MISAAHTMRPLPVTPRGTSAAGAAPVQYARVNTTFERPPRPGHGNLAAALDQHRAQSSFKMPIRPLPVINRGL
jgi:hypothetical protein